LQYYSRIWTNSNKIPHFFFWQKNSSFLDPWWNIQSASTPPRIIFFAMERPWWRQRRGPGERGKLKEYIYIFGVNGLSIKSDAISCENYYPENFTKVTHTRKFVTESILTLLTIPPNCRLFYFIFNKKQMTKLHIWSYTFILNFNLVP
jgi:hypothetical protein